MRILFDIIAYWLNTHTDKVYHFAVCVLVVLWSSVFIPLLGAVIIAVAVSLVKEWWDKWRGGTFDYCDLIADALGIASAAIPLILI